MSDKGIRNSFQVEWVNVTYRAVMITLALVLALVGGGGGTWFYLTHVRPMQLARSAIERAEHRIGETEDLQDSERVAELAAQARAKLTEARDRFAEQAYHLAEVRAAHADQLALQALSLASANRGEERKVRFYRIEGDVRVKSAGKFSWTPAKRDMQLTIGDQVKTSSSGSAELIYFDGTMTTLRPGSLLEIRDLYEDPVTKVRRVREKLSWGEAHASTQQRNVSGSYHEVATEKVTTKSDGQGEFLVTFDRESGSSVVDVFEGQIEVSGGGRKEIVDAGERLSARPDGSLTAKQSLPNVPRLLAPSDERVFIFENPVAQQLALQWEPVAGAGSYRLTIASGSLFTSPLFDATRNGTTATLEGVPPGAYCWRVAAVSKAGNRGPFSATRHFRVSSEQIRDRSDTVPPRLEITEFVPVGQMVIINGETEPGASLWVNQDKVEVFEDGTFNTVVKLRKEGMNELVLVAQDTAGNETKVKQAAFVEVY